MSRRVAAARSFLKFSAAQNPTLSDVIYVLYKLLWDDEEPIRYMACQIARDYFDSVVVNSALFYVDEIWHFVSQNSSAVQVVMFNRLFYQDFVKDFNREWANIIDRPIFRTEPQNLYRDYYVEVAILKQHILPSAIEVDYHLIEKCKEKTAVELGFLYRNSKCLSLLTKS